MPKFTAILIMAIALLCGSLSAQDGLETKKDGDKTRLTGKLTDIPIEDLIRMTCDMQHIRVIYDPKKVRGNVTFLAPRGELDVPNGAFFSLLQLSLKQFRMCLIPTGEDSKQSIKIYEIVPANEAVTTAHPVIFMDDIESWEDTTYQFMTMVVNLKHADANSVRGALQNLPTRQGGQVNPIAGINSLIICDYSDNIRRMAKIIKLLDVPAAQPKLELLKLVHADPETIAQEINSLIKKRLSNDQASRKSGYRKTPNTVSIEASP